MKVKSKNMIRFVSMYTMYYSYCKFEILQTRKRFKILNSMQDCEENANFNVNNC